MAWNEHLWVRYLPGVVAAAGGVALIVFAPPRRRIGFAVLATLLGLTCMEAEYWIAHGFPESEVPFFVLAIALTLLTLPFASRGALGLSVVGLAFFAYVNIRYGAPYLLDYVLPLFYALLVVLARREGGWRGGGVLAAGWPETLWLLTVNAVTIWRTTALDKWGWLLGRPW
jgi:hypothetical protein